MNLSVLLDDLSNRGVRMWVEEDHLRLRAPQGVLTKELQATLSKHKPEILKLLRQGGGPERIEPRNITGTLPLSYMQERNRAPNDSKYQIWHPETIPVFGVL